MRRIILMVFLSLAVAATLSAQAPTTPTTTPTTPETFTITETHGQLKLSDPNPDVVVFLVKGADGKLAADQTLVVTRVRGDALIYDIAKGTDSAGTSVELTTDEEGKARLSVVMKNKTRLELDVKVKDSTALPTQVSLDAAFGGARVCADENDCRDETALTFYSGMVFDSFASDSYNVKFNPDEKGKIKQKPVFGLDFDRRITGAPGGSGWWLYGETLHGTRSLEVDCSQGNPTTSSDQADPPDAPDTNDKNPCNDTDAALSSDFVGVLRNAQSLEAYAGLRYEWSPVNFTKGALLYSKLQFGFMTVAGDGGDVIDNHHLGLGLLMTKGKFRDSYVEVGVGKTDLFKTHRNARLKVDGYVSYSMKGNLEEAFITPFLQMTVDADGVGGADSIQIYTGLNFAFDLLKITANNQ